MRKIAAILAILLGVIPIALLLVVAPLPGTGQPVARAQAPWTNGQEALYVLGQSDFTSSSQGTSASQFRYPRDVAIDHAHGKMYVADTNNHRVLRFDYPVSGNLPTADLVFGQPDFSSYTAGSGQTAIAYPSGLAVDDSGRLWISDTGNHRVLWFNAAYALTGNQPSANGVLGQPHFLSSSSGLSQSRMSSPFDLAVSAEGTLFVAESANHRVLRFDQAASKANGANADAVLGQADFTSRLTATTQSGMNTPQGVAIDADGTLFVAESANHRVLRFDQAASKANGAAADGVLGQPDFTSSGLSVSQSGLTYPGRLAVDDGGRLYVSDTYTANRVLIYTDAADKADGGPADYVLGQAGFTSSGGDTEQDRLFMTQSGGGLAVDTLGGLLLVADDDNNRVLVFQAQEALIAPQFEIRKTGPASGLTGNPITYTLTVTNSGYLTATRVTITDTLPAAAIYLDGGTLLPGGVVSWTLPTLGIDAAAQLQFSVTALETITNSQYGVRSAEGAAAQGVQAVVTEFLPFPELTITKTAPQRAAVGSPVTYTLTVYNSGLGAATNLVVTDTLPSGATYLGGGELQPEGFVRWTLPGLGPDQSADFQFSVSAAQNLTNRDYRVTSAEGDSAEGEQVVVTEIYQLPGLSISKSGPPAVRVGAPILYTLTVRNDGPGEATDLVITDTLPAGATYLDGGELLAGGVVRWTLDSLGIGATAQVQFSAAALETVTNSQYGVTCAEGITAQGSQAVTTEPRQGLFLPLTRRAVRPER